MNRVIHKVCRSFTLPGWWLARKLRSVKFTSNCSVPTAVAMSCLLAVFATNGEQSLASDESAMSEVFAEQHVQNTTLDVHRRAMQLPAEERYEFLFDWVLPNEDHDTLRMQYAFDSLSPSPVSVDGQSQHDSSGKKSRVQTGGRIISPVFDLLDVAEELNRLDELHDRVAGWAANGRSRKLIHQAAMLTLIELARKRETATAARLDEFLRLQSKAGSGRNGPTSPELLVFERCIENEATHQAVADAMRGYLKWTRSEWNRTPAKRHVASMFGRLGAFGKLATAASARPVSEQPLRQWSPVSRTTAATRGPGCPQPRWDYRPGHVENIVSHDDDYLYFNTPLRGNFEVECDVSGFGWRDTHLMVGGTWVAPVYTHAAYDHGNFHTIHTRMEFSPPLTATKEWIHYRTVVRDRVISTYFNGRLVRQGMVTRDHDPWIAIRSSVRSDGAVRNLRITGQPVIPEEIRLSVDPNFSGWLSYFGKRVGRGNGHWQQQGRTTGGGEITGRRLTTPSRPAGFVASLLKAFSGPAQNVDRDSDREIKLPPHQERLLRYHRPMLEDGTIDYDFYYVPGETHTHPAIDRLAFLLDPEGVRIHWVTDGADDRSELSPANVFDEPENRRGPNQLPLKAGDWNHLQIRLSGDTVTLTLNDEVVYERPLESSNQRTFGLFHFTDETQARVRNIVWKGDWARQLPPLVEQELAIDGTDFLDRDIEKLPAVFEHDFVNDGLPMEQFTILRGDPTEHVRHVEEGVLATRTGLGGYRNATITPGLKVHGDFDVIAKYDGFEASPSKEGNAALMLLLVLDNATTDECTVLKRHVRGANGSHQHFVQCVHVGRPVDGERREYFGSVPMEERSGRLRLSRRGDQVYYLTAEGDSSHFQLRGQRTVATDDVQIEGLRLLSQIYQKGGEVSVTWKSLIVRAEELSGRAVEDIDFQLVKLNEERDKLKSHFAFDFSKQAPPPLLFLRWTDSRPWNKDHNGLLITAPGTDQWTSAGVTVMKHVTGDFDISVAFDVQKFDTPKAKERSSIYLKLQLPDKDETELSVIFIKDDHGSNEVIAQVREPRGKGKFLYRPLGEIDLSNVTTLRMARRGERLTFLASAKNSKHDRIVGFLDRPAIPTSPIRFFLHTGGADRETRVLWKSIDIRADEIPGSESPLP